MFFTNFELFKKLLLNPLTRVRSKHFMNRFFRFLFFLVFLGFVQISFAQVNTDTLQLSRNYSARQDFKSAIRILKTYSQNHPTDVFATQLLAQNLYWNGNIDEADSIYRYSIENYPQSTFFKLDYGRMLYNDADYDRAKLVLDDYLENDPNNVEALIYTGYINYWWGRYDISLDNFIDVLKQYPQNPTAVEMVKAIRKVTQPYLFAGYQISFDSQPMQSGDATIETGKFHNSLFTPIIRLDWLHFNAEGFKKQTPWLRVSNQMNFLKNKTHLNATVGFLQDVSSKLLVTGLLELTQDLNLNQDFLDKISLRLSAERSPYFYTTSSLLQPVMYNAFNVSVIFSDASGISGKLFAGRQFFMDGNQIDNVYAWVLSPRFGGEKLKINVGYSYNYTNSNVNHYESKYTLDEILADYKPGQLEGIYNPYFTPIKQNIHSVLATLSLRTDKKIEWQLKNSLGLFSYADIPYLYLDRMQNNNLFINSGFSKEYKVPFEIALIATYHINEFTTLNASYTYTENFFYYNNLFNLNLKHIF